MKKHLAAALYLLTCSTCLALPVGNPSEASLFSYGVWWDSACSEPYDPCFSLCDSLNLRFGFAGDYNFNRHMERDKGDVGEDIEVTEIFTNSAYLAMNICHRVDIFGKLGASRIHIRTDAVSWGSPTSLMSELDLETYLSWSVGGRATLFRCGCFTVGAEGEYFQTVPDVDSFLNYETGALSYFDDNADTFYSEWQFGLGVSYTIATQCPSFAFVPYTAVKWSGSCLKLYDFRFEDFQLNDLKAKKFWGYAVGLSFTMCQMVGVTVEGRFADEKALYVNGQARF